MKKMKHRILISISFAAFLCGCVRNDVLVPEQDQRAICFNDPIISNMTKVYSGEIAGIYPEGESFAVFGVYHDDDVEFNGWETPEAVTYIDRAEFSYNASVDDDDADVLGGWTGGYYFPKNGVLSFAAYSPYRAHAAAAGDGTGVFTYGDEGLKIDDFSVASDASQQFDLMFSNRIYNKKSSTGSDSPYEGLDLNFTHILSSVCFKLQQADEYPGVTLRLKSISIAGVRYKGDFAEKITDPTSTAYASDPAWSVADDLIAGEYYAYDQPDDDHIMLTGYYGTKGALLLDGEMDPAKNKNGQTQEGQNDLLLMPQVFKEGSTVKNSDAEIEIVYTVQNGAGPKVPQTAEVKLSDLTDKWEMGKRYIYNVTIGLNKIYFGPTVEGWTNVEVPAVTM